MRTSSGQAFQRRPPWRGFAAFPQSEGLSATAAFCHSAPRSRPFVCRAIPGCEALRSAEMRAHSFYWSLFGGGGEESAFLAFFLSFFLVFFVLPAGTRQFFTSSLPSKHLLQRKGRAGGHVWDTLGLVPKQGHCKRPQNPGIAQEGGRLSMLTRPQP